MDVLCIVLMAALVVLILYVVFSWVPRPPEPILPIVRLVNRIVTPVLEPIRRIMPPLRFGGVGLDLSVLVVFIVISILQGLVCS